MIKGFVNVRPIDLQSVQTRPKNFFCNSLPPNIPSLVTRQLSAWQLQQRRIEISETHSSFTCQSFQRYFVKFMLSYQKQLWTFYFIPKQKSDLTSPTCEVESFDDNVCRGSGSAPCESVRWNVSVKVQDMESGLTIFKAGVSYPHASFSNDVFQKGTNDEVKGRYESSCCFPNITIVAVDGNGNVGRCSLRMVSAAQPSLTTSFFSDLISLIVSMILAKLA